MLNYSERGAAETCQSPSAGTGERPSTAQRHADVVEIPEGCSSVCCVGEAPHQPRDRAVLKKTARTQGRTRYFNPAWYDAHPWLTLCTSTESVKAFCSVCRDQKSKGILGFSKNRTLGFSLKASTTGKRPATGFKSTNGPTRIAKPAVRLWLHQGRKVLVL